MSRQSMAPPRALSLTDELERLEQSITLTLQEIDENFSRAHRIVTTSILPLVNQYGKNSEEVLEGSKFWKLFFEASANVSLSGYSGDDNETTIHEDIQQSQVYEDETVDGETVTGTFDTTTTPSPPRPASAQADAEEDISEMESPTIAHAHSTPRAPPAGGKEPMFADFSSPYETLREEIQGTRTPKLNPTTPSRAQALPNMNFDSSPFIPPTSTKRNPAQDPVLHHVLDKTYRIQATPLISPRKYKPTGGFTPSAARRTAATPQGASSRLPKWDDDSSPESSPAPQLRADIFSPLKTPRTPGVSVQTLGQGKQPFSVTKTGVDFFDDSDSDGDGFSPPKTIQFAVPQSRLLQTPAREASKRIVDDLLLTAGGDLTETGLDDEDSPSVVRRQVNMDDTF